MLAKLKKLLSECHITKQDMLLKVTEKADKSYCIRRAIEEIEMALCEENLGDGDDRLIRAIQLLNLARYKWTLSELSEPSSKDRKQKSKATSSPSSKHTTGT